MTKQSLGELARELGFSTVSVGTKKPKAKRKSAPKKPRAPKAPKAPPLSKRAIDVLRKNATKLYEDWNNGEGDSSETVMIGDVGHGYADLEVDESGWCVTANGKKIHGEAWD